MNECIEKELSKIFHFKIHPEMKPFVGEMYDAFRIILIGESHYTDLGSNKNNFDEIQTETEQWYSASTDELPRYQDFISWYTTRRVLNNFLTHDRSGAHTMFSNPAKVLKEIVKENLGITINDCDAINAFIFCNYYQRPEINRGSSFTVRTRDDWQISGETIYQIINNPVIHPNLVIFASKKAFEAYSEWTGSHKKTTENFQYVAHPTCPHWYNENGEMKLKELLSPLVKENENVIKGALEERKKKKISAMKIIMQKLVDYLKEKGFCVEEYYDTTCDHYYDEERPASYPYIKSKALQHGIPVFFHIGIEWRLYCGIYDEKGKNIKNNWQYIPSKENLIDFLGFAQKDFSKDIDVYNDEWFNALTESIGVYLQKNELKPVL